MSSAAPSAPSALLDHVGPWTEQDYLALPEDRRIELLDGGLLMSPSAGSRRQRLSSQLWLALGKAAPSGLEVLEAINVRVASGRILIPDLVVVTKPGLDLAVWDPPEVAMVVEIVSPGGVAADRAIKPQRRGHRALPADRAGRPGPERGGLPVAPGALRRGRVRQVRPGPVPG